MCSPCWPGEEVLSIEAKNLIVSLLQREPNARPTAREVMSHNWMQQEKRLMPLISLIADSSTVPISLPSGHSPLLFGPLFTHLQCQLQKTEMVAIIQAFTGQTLVNN